MNQNYQSLIEKADKNRAFLIFKLILQQLQIQLRTLINKMTSRVEF